MKKKYVVSMSFTVEEEAESASHAISSAAFQLKYGVEDPGSLRLEIVAELPADEVQIPAPIEAPTTEAAVVPPRDDIPF